MRTPLIALALTSVLASASAFAAAPAPATCPAAPLLRALGALRTGPGLAVERAADRVTLHDRVRGRVLLAVSCEGIAVAGPSDAPSPKGGAATEVVRDARGATVYTHSAPPLGARITVIPPGLVSPRGLDLTVFDNDDVHLADGAGALVYQRQTAADGTLTEREGRGHGCGCERVTAPDGRVTTAPLPAR